LGYKEKRKVREKIKKTWKRLVEANINLEHYWFVIAPQPPKGEQGLPDPDRSYRE
jgi:hypothetical protein